MKNLENSIKLEHEVKLKKENLAMKIMLLRDKQINGMINFDDALKEAVKLIKEYDM